MGMKSSEMLKRPRCLFQKVGGGLRVSRLSRVCRACRVYGVDRVYRVYRNPMCIKGL